MSVKHKGFTTHRLLKALLGVELTVFNSTTVAVHTAIEAIKEADKRNFRYKADNRTVLASLLSKRKSACDPNLFGQSLRDIIQINQYNQEKDELKVTDNSLNYK